MFVRKLLGLATTLAVFSACGEAPTTPQPLEGLGAAAPSFGMNGNGNGALVDRFEDNGIVVLTTDANTGLLSVHYSDSDVLSGAVGCAVPSFHSTLERLNVVTPNGRFRDQTSGEVYVVVHELAGFPDNVFSCQAPLAEGTVRLHVSVSVAPPGSPGETVASFGSDGAITHSDGGDVRLHHSRQGLQAPLGTVRLRRVRSTTFRRPLTSLLIPR